MAPEGSEVRTQQRTTVVRAVGERQGFLQGLARPSFLREWTGPLMSVWAVIFAWVAVTAAAGAFSLALLSSEDALIAGQTAAAADATAGIVKAVVDARGHSLARFTIPWSIYGSPGPEEWARTAETIRSGLGFAAIGWRAPSRGGQAWIAQVGAGLGAELPPPVELVFAGRLARFRAGDRAAYWLVGHGGRIWFATPAPAPGARDAVLIGVASAGELLHPVLSTATLPDFSASIAASSGEMLLPAMASGVDAARWSAAQAVDFAGDRWQVVVTPTADRIERVRQDTPRLSLILGVAIATLLAGLVRATQLALGAADEARLAGERLRNSEAEVRELNQQLELRVEERTEALARSNRDLEQFAYAASHDLQEPLRMVISYLQLIERRYGSRLDAQGNDFLRFAVDGGKRMREMIRALLHYARLGRQELEPMSVDLDRVVADACANLDVAIAETGAVIDRMPLPTVVGNPDLLVQLFQNLIANSLKYCEVTPEILLSASPRSDGWEVSVRDNGIGIPPEAAQRVFELFQRLHGRERFSGTGIGLAVCNRIVELHGGTIAVDPGMTTGTRIVVWFPTRARQATASRSAATNSLQLP